MARSYSASPRRISSSSSASHLETLRPFSEDEEVVFSALQAFRKTDADFADALIVYKTLKIASGESEAPVIFTFDTDALQLPHAARPGSR